MRFQMEVAKSKWIPQQAIRQRYQVDFERSQQEVIDYLRRYQVPLVTVDTDENPNELQQVFLETMNLKT